MDYAAELPVEFFIEVGRYATDWSVIEQGLLLHALDMSGDVAPTRPGFSGLRNYWFKLASTSLPARRAEIHDLNRRLVAGALSRGYFLHGRWKQTGDDEFTARWLDVRGGKITAETLVSTSAGIVEQNRKVRDLRCDLVLFLKSIDSAKY